MFESVNAMNVLMFLDMKYFQVLMGKELHETGILLSTKYLVHVSLRKKNEKRITYE